ncbi:MAG: serine/threonine protein kinase [Gammaproteobacteria bacterium]|nr:serine/threonine protein kinase [Gammaproteobacteria bacterium]
MQIPGYTIERLLGKGGMSSVYLAKQDSLGRRVALKVLKRFDDPGQAERFLHEGRIIASLHHRNIITIHDIGMVGERPFIAMEYLEGGSLADRIEAGMPLDKALALLEQVAACLHYVHRRGIVHRDIKPGNILFHADGTPKLTDFGIAKLLDSDQELTMDGTALGSPYYLSPEQAEGRPLDGRSDIYALGIVFHQLLTGQRPYARESPVETIVAHLTQPLPILPPNLKGYQGLLESMLAKRPEDRIATAKELAYRLRDAKRALQVVAARPASPARGQPGRPRRSWVAVVAGVVAVLVLLYLVRRPEPAAPVVVAQDTEGTEVSPALQEPVPAREAAAFADLAPAAVTREPTMALLSPEPPTGLGVLPDAAPLTVVATATARPAPAAPAQVTGMPDGSVATLLQAAGQALDELRLTRPGDDNAYDYFQQVLAIDPENAEARAGIRAIAERYAGMGQVALRDDKVGRAQRYLERGLAVDPDAAALAALRGALAQHAGQQAAQTVEADQAPAEPTTATSIRGQQGSGNMVKDLGKVWRAIFD